MCKICSVEGCNEVVKAKGLCNKHYIQAKKGKVLSKSALNNTKKLLKAIAEENDYTVQKDIKNIGKQKKYEIQVFDNGTSSIKDKSCDFVTKEGNMRVPQLRDKEVLMNYVDDQYFIYASLILQWAVNNKDCLIKNPNTDDKLIANDLMIKELFAKYSRTKTMSDRKYREVMNHLIEKGVIYKTSRRTILSEETVVYMANPLFTINFSCELTPEAFLAFHDILAKKIPEKTMNEMFGLCLKSIAWNSKCEALVMANEKAEADKEFKKNLSDLVKQLGLENRVLLMDTEETAIEKVEDTEEVVEPVDNNYEEDIIEIARNLEVVKPKIPKKPVLKNIKREYTQEEKMSILTKLLSEE